MTIEHSSNIDENRLDDPNCLLMTQMTTFFAYNTKYYGIIFRVYQLQCNVNIIEDVRMAKMPPCDMLALTAWDQRYSTTLPDSIRDFYLARSK